MHLFGSNVSLVLAIIAAFALHTTAIPLAAEGMSEESASTPTLDIDESTENVTANATRKDLYVIKAVVYEIGILTEVDENSTDEGYS